MGSLDIPNQTFLNECLPLESSSNVKSNIILHTVDDVLRQLRTKQEIFALLLTDAAWYMSLAGKTLKKLYPTSMHITCIAHLLHKFIMRARAFFKNIYDVVRDGNRSGRPAPVGSTGTGRVFRPDGVLVGSRVFDQPVKLVETPVKFFFLATKSHLSTCQNIRIYFILNETFYKKKSSINKPHFSKTFLDFCC